MRNSSVASRLIQLAPESKWELAPGLCSDDFVFMVALYDDEYWEYISKMDRLPETYNDIAYDYLLYPEHAHAREQSHAALQDYDKWLENMGAYDRYGRLHCKTCLDAF